MDTPKSIRIAAVSVVVIGTVGIGWVVTPHPADPPSAGALPAPLSRTALVYDQETPGSGTLPLRVGDPLGRASRSLTTPGAGFFDTHPVRSPDGMRVLFNRESDSGNEIRVLTIGLPGSERVIPTGCADVPDCVVDNNPTWSRDGTRVMFTRVMGPFDETGGAASARLYSTALDGSDLRRISSADLPLEVEEVGARPTPDGEYLVLLRDVVVDGELHFAVFRMRPDASDIVQLTPWSLNADRPVPSPARTGPTAGLLAFETFGGARPGRGDIALMPWNCASVADCTAKTRLVTHNDGGPKSSFAATWSRDGAYLAYAEEPRTDGTVDVWTSRWDGSHRHQVTTSHHAFSPSWGS